MYAFLIADTMWVSLRVVRVPRLIVVSIPHWAWCRLAGSLAPGDLCRIILGGKIYALQQMRQEAKNTPC